MSIPDLVASRLSPNKTVTPDPNRSSPSVMTLPNKQKTRHSKIPHSTSFPPPVEESETPPPLPKRNKQTTDMTNNATQSKLDPRHVFTDESDSILNRNSKIPKNINAMFLDNEINSNVRQQNTPSKSSPKKGSSRYGSQNLFGSKSSLSDMQNVLNMNLKSPTKSSSDGKNRNAQTTNLKKSNSNPTKGVMVENALYNTEPPPLPPRAPTSLPGSSDPDAVNSINKQMSYPLVATCATLVNNYVSNSSL